jgi:hypothetical protein
MMIWSRCAGPFRVTIELANHLAIGHVPELRAIAKSQPPDIAMAAAADPLDFHPKNGLKSLRQRMNGAVCRALIPPEMASTQAWGYPRGPIRSREVQKWASLFIWAGESVVC